MADRDAWEQSLFRFAAILLRDPELARRVTLEVMAGAEQKPPAQIDDERLAIFLFQGVRRRALRDQGRTSSSAVPRGELPSDAAVVAEDAPVGAIEAALHALTEPGRSALALLLVDAMEADSIAKLLGLGEAELAQTLHGARLSLHAALDAPRPQAAASN